VLAQVRPVDAVLKEEGSLPVFRWTAYPRHAPCPCARPIRPRIKRRCT